MLMPMLIMMPVPMLVLMLMLRQMLLEAGLTPPPWLHHTQQARGLAS